MSNHFQGGGGGGPHFVEWEVCDWYKFNHGTHDFVKELQLVNLLSEKFYGIFLDIDIAHSTRYMPLSKQQSSPIDMDQFAVDLHGFF